MATQHFTLSPKEYRDAQTWINKHPCDKRHSGAFWVKYIFSPTGIGTGIEVECNCGAKVNVTDYLSW